MWDKWKRKLDNFIWKEVEEEDTQEYHLNQDLNPDIKTRIVYQYPNNETYHIPQIPDHKRRINRPMVDTETPAYLRKGKRQAKPAHMEEYPEREQVLKEKRPFERTEVPSPIYGFRKQNSKEIESIPTYLRKHQILSEQAPTEPELNEPGIEEPVTKKNSKVYIVVKLYLWMIQILT
ncbi:hypothetical protein [Ornithinibacillus scapharcae]|uniref:hypothetical protein n=1 Tax=Ornithinibacillus scapharcae TaxID=1147159 RepID=UPI000225ADE6|nr:hypothetical protein [Ornithinibacillus scapharcae]